MELLSKTHIPAIAVVQDTAETDAQLYKCYTNTKLQLYDRMKHKLIVDLFNEHFDAKRFCRTFGL